MPTPTKDRPKPEHKPQSRDERRLVMAKLILDRLAGKSIRRVRIDFAQLRRTLGPDQVRQMAAARTELALKQLQELKETVLEAEFGDEARPVPAHSGGHYRPRSRRS